MVNILRYYCCPYATVSKSHTVCNALLDPTVASILRDSIPTTRDYKRKCANMETKSENYDAKHMTVYECGPLLRKYY